MSKIFIAILVLAIVYIVCFESIHHHIDVTHNGINTIQKIIEHREMIENF